MLQERLEHHDAVNKLSADRIRVTVQSKLDAENQALLQEKHAREDDTARVLLHYESAVAQIEQLQREERQQRDDAGVARELGETSLRVTDKSLLRSNAQGKERPGYP